MHSTGSDKSLNKNFKWLDKFSFLLGNVMETIFFNVTLFCLAPQFQFRITSSYINLNRISMLQIFSHLSGSLNIFVWVHQLAQKCLENCMKFVCFSLLSVGIRVDFNFEHFKHGSALIKQQIGVFINPKAYWGYKFYNFKGKFTHFLAQRTTGLQKKVLERDRGKL